MTRKLRTPSQDPFYDHRFDPDLSDSTVPPHPPQTPAEIIEEALSAGCSEDEAAACAKLSRGEYQELLTTLLQDDPDWLKNAIHKAHSLTGDARIALKRALAEKTNTSLALEVLGRRDPGWSPKAFLMPPPAEAPKLSPAEKDKLQDLFPEAIETTARIKPYEPLPEPTEDSDQGTD